MAIELGWPIWIGVVTDDLEGQRRFYRETLGLTETDYGEGWVNFDLGGNMFELVRRGSERQYDSRRYQVGFVVTDIESARAALIKAGVEPLTEIEGEPGSRNRWCYFRDPEGNVFELTQWMQPPIR